MRTTEYLPWPTSGLRAPAAQSAKPKVQKTSALESVSCATGKYSRRIEKMLVNCTSSGVLTRIESDPSLVRLSRRRIAYCARMSSQFGQHIDFRCRHCGARYVVSYTKLPIADSGSAYCECCKRRMFQWNSASQPRYRLTCPSSAGQCIGAFTGLFEGDIANPS
jgi:hypothetical protein